MTKQNCWNFRVSFAAGAKLAAVLLLVAVTSTTKAETGKREELSRRVQDVVDGHIIPRLQHLMQSAETLSRDVNNSCASGNQSGWGKTKSSFSATVVAWAAVSHLRFGPVALEGRAQRLSFWPDPRGIVWRQLRPVLARRDTTLLVPGALPEQSVALQGLTALEILIQEPIATGEGATKDDLYKCKLARAIAANVASTSKGMVHGWTREGGWRKRILNPGPNNKVYSTPQEAAAELVKSAMLGFLIVRDQQLNIVQKAMTEKGKLSRMPYHRSGLSADYLATSISSSCEMVEKLDLAPFIPDDKTWLREWLPNACRIMNDAASNFQIPQTPDQLWEADNKSRFRKLRFYSNGIRQVIGRDIAPAAGLTIGFNELDGD